VLRSKYEKVRAYLRRGSAKPSGRADQVHSTALEEETGWSSKASRLVWVSITLAAIVLLSTLTGWNPLVSFLLFLGGVLLVLFLWLYASGSSDK
jgi:Flp pilus assembly protein TadB